MYHAPENSFLVRVEDGEFTYGIFLGKNKFTHVSNTPNSIRKNFNQAINLENNSSQYFTPNDLTTLNYKRNNDFSVFYIKINFLQYHFNELQNFLSNFSFNFQILGISDLRLKLTSQYQSI